MDESAPTERGRARPYRGNRYATALRGELTLDVNEQNVSAQRFYAACGFTVEGRSEFDSAGQPYPLLHMCRPGGAPVPKVNKTSSWVGGR